MYTIYNVSFLANLKSQYLVHLDMSNDFLVRVVDGYNALMNWIETEICRNGTARLLERLLITRAYSATALCHDGLRSIQLSVFSVSLPSSLGSLRCHISGVAWDMPMRAY